MFVQNFIQLSAAVRDW